MARYLRSFTHRILPWIVLVHTGLFILFWITNSLFYSSTNDYLTEKLGQQLDYISIFLGFAWFLGAWSIVHIVLNQRKVIHRLVTFSAWLYAAIGLIFIVFFYGSFMLLFQESPVQVPRLVQLLMFYRIILDPLILICAAILLGIGFRKFFLRRRSAGKRSDSLILVPVLLSVVVLWAAGLVVPPGTVYQGTLPPKPLIIAHRGASVLAPENTLASAELAAGLGVYGLETDIHISLDGVPFLMHDDTLNRTTNVSFKFPDRAKDRAEYFTIAEIKQLNGGNWFIEQDPFGAIANGKVTSEQILDYQKQNVPTLAEELEIVQTNRLIFIFDLKQPPEDQPYAQSFFDLVLEQLKQAGINEQVWFLVDQSQLPVLESIAPQMKPVIGIDYQSPPAAAVIKEAGYQIVNSEYGLSESWIRTYQDAGLWVNLYTIDEPWQFSRLWLLGVDSTTTSNAHVMMSLESPMLGIPYNQYLALWIVVGLLSLALATGISLTGVPAKKV